MLVPSSLGGGESDPATFVATVEELARRDAAAGWCIAACATSGMVAAYIDEAAAQDVFGAGASVSGGVFAPRGTAYHESASYLVTGRWAFASGIDHCDWLMGGCMVFENGTRKMLGEGRPDIRLALFPASEVEVIDTWSVSGLRGTGSHDMQVHEIRVPADRTTSLLTDKPLERGPLYAFPIFGLLALSIAGVALGIARAALDDITELAGGKTPTLSSRRLADRPGTQAAVARAEAAWRAARELLYAEIERGWAEARLHGEVSVDGEGGAAAGRHARDDRVRPDRGCGLRTRWRNLHLRDEPAPAALPRHTRRHAAHARRPGDVGADRASVARASDGSGAALAVALVGTWAEPNRAV